MTPQTSACLPKASGVFSLLSMSPHPSRGANQLAVRTEQMSYGPWLVHPPIWNGFSALTGSLVLLPASASWPHPCVCECECVCESVSVCVFSMLQIYFYFHP